MALRLFTGNAGSLCRGMKPKFTLLSALAALAPLSAQASPSAPEQILSEAARYTVKINTLGDIGLNKDEGGSSTGTGFLIDRERGWILTNAHVSSRSPAKIEVSFKGGEPIRATRVHIDAFIDLAVLQIPAEQIAQNAIEAKLACAELPEPGTSVFAYGHPWGLSFTASRGVISGLSWFFPSEQIQTDAAINSGNSGGPLISLSNGLVVGINSATYRNKDDDNATAIGLAEPLPPICHVIQLMRDGADTRVRMLPLATGTSGDDLRPRVAKTFAGGEAFQPGDLITKINGRGNVRSLPDLLDRLRGLDGMALVTVERQGREVRVRAPLIVKPDLLSVKAIGLSGLIISEPWRLDDQELNPEGNLVVDWVEMTKEAGLTDAATGDNIASVDGRSFRRLDALYAYLQTVPDGQTVDFIFYGYSGAPEFFREYRHVTLTKVGLKLISVRD